MPGLLSNRKRRLNGSRSAGPPPPRGPTEDNNGLGAARATAPPPISPPYPSDQDTASKAAGSVGQESDSSPAAQPDASGSVLPTEVAGARRGYGYLLGKLVYAACEEGIASNGVFAKSLRAIARATVLVLALFLLGALVGSGYAAYLAFVEHRAPSGLPYLAGGAGLGFGGVGGAAGTVALSRWRRRRRRPPVD